MASFFSSSSFHSLHWSDIVYSFCGCCCFCSSPTNWNISYAYTHTYVIRNLQPINRFICFIIQLIAHWKDINWLDACSLHQTVYQWFAFIDSFYWWISLLICRSKLLLLFLPLITATDTDTAAVIVHRSMVMLSYTGQWISSLLCNTYTVQFMQTIIATSVNLLLDCLCMCIFPVRLNATVKWTAYAQSRLMQWICCNFLFIFINYRL